MPKQTLRVVARVKAKPDKSSELRALLVGLLAPTRQEPGCIVYELLVNEDDPNDFVFVEEWESRAALDSHFETDHIRGGLERLPELLAEDLDLRRYRLVG